MVCTVIVEFQITPETADEFRQAIHEALKETRNRDGNLMCEELHNQDDVCNFVVFQKWASREKYETYLNWRMESGMMEEISHMMTEEPSIRFYDQAEAG